MSSATAEGDGFAEQLAQSSPDHSSPRSRTDFLPWHKPRKFWLRENQWQAEAKVLVQNLNIVSKGRPVTYLTLPGPDLLDVRGIKGVCEAEQVPLRYLGFMDGSADDKTELALSKNEVNSDLGVDNRSDVLPDQFQTLAEKGSVGFQRAEAIAPFDIVNIDLCGTVADSPPLNKQRGYYDAIQQLILLQKSRRAPDEPWLLFLTTRCNFDKVDIQAASHLFESLLDNYLEHEHFREAAHAHLGANEDRLRRFAAGELGSDARFEDTFAAAVSKWILGLLSVGRPSCTIEILPTSVTYGVVRPNGRDMISLGFLCRTIIDEAADPAGLANVPAGRQDQVAEVAAAVQILERLGSLQNVDEVLSKAGEYERYAQIGAKAMKDARFDPAAYVSWAMEQREAPVQVRLSRRGSPGPRPRSASPRGWRAESPVGESAFATALKAAMDKKNQ